MKKHLFRLFWPLILPLIMSIALTACGRPENSTEENLDAGLPVTDPNVKIEGNFAKLINSSLEGKVTRTPWTGYYWPYTQDGVASTQFAENSGSFFFPKHESATAKYDSAHRGKTKADAWERANHGKRVRGVEGWWGHCNGWATAAALFPEPRKSVRIGSTTFSVGDIKALLTEASMEAQADFFGNRVDKGTDPADLKYQDTVPAQYFLVLTNFIGRAGRPVLIDRFTGDQVWNQPLAGYRFQYPKREDYLGATAENPGVYKILLTSTIWWVRDDVKPDTVTQTFAFSDYETFQSRTLKMELWLDAPVAFDNLGKISSSGNVVVTHQGEQYFGGAWRMGNGYYNDAWPDYMWVPYSVTSSTGYTNPELDLDWIQSQLNKP